jgi:2-dehydro-3-deoxyphosphogluconate aldolase / (4S)-4-hydroxy-2-oxoglutarate aldolase
MKRERVFDVVKRTGVVAVIRADSAEECEKLAAACIKGGIKAIEITMTVPGAEDIIKSASKKYGKNDDVLIGAGTVLDPETARICIMAGARFIVSPMLNIDTIKLCNRYAVAVIPGVMTVTEAVRAMEYGCSVLKLFPGNAYGPSIIKSFMGPLPQAEFMPTGGVSIENAGTWIKAGAVAVGTGSDLTKCCGDFDAVTKKAALFIKAVEEARFAAPDL